MKANVIPSCGEYQYSRSTVSRRFVAKDAGVVGRRYRGPDGLNASTNPYPIPRDWRCRCHPATDQAEDQPLCFDGSEPS